MNRLMYFLCALTFLFLAVGCNNESNKKGTPTPGYSENIDASKKIGAFKYEVMPDRNKLVFDSTLHVEIKQAWVENGWWKQGLVFGKAPAQIEGSTFQLIITLNLSGTSKYYYFIGSNRLDTLVHYNCKNYYSNRIDSIHVPLYKEQENDLPPRYLRRAFDSLVFIKHRYS